MQIKEVEQKTGLTRRAIRYYEQQGLISTTRGTNRYKIYSEETVDTLLYVKQLRLLDFSVKEIKSILVEKNVEAIILEKLEENEERLKKAYGVKRILNKMLHGERVETIDVDRLLLEEKKKSYMYIRYHNFIFGLLNVFVFIVIHLFMFSKLSNIGESNQLYFFMMLQLIIIALWLSYLERRKKLAREKGILQLEIKPVERLFQFATHCSTYILTSYMCVEGFYYAKKYIGWGEDYFLVLGNIMLGLLMFSLGVVMLILSFQDSNKRSGEYI